MSNKVFLEDYEQIFVLDTELEELGFTVTWKIKVRNSSVEMVYVVFLKWDGKAVRAIERATFQESAVKIFLTMLILGVKSMFTYWVLGLTDNGKL